MRTADPWTPVAMERVKEERRGERRVVGGWSRRKKVHHSFLSDFSGKECR